MRPRPIGVALAAAAVAAAGVAPALGASRTVTVDGWYPRIVAFSGDRLVWTEAATVHVDPARIPGSPPGARRFDYYRAEVFRVPLNRASTRFRGDVETPVSVRESIAAMDPGSLAPTGDGGFVMAPGSRRFAPPVIRCCDAAGIETVIESDGRPDAPVTVAAGWTGTTARYAQIAAGALVLRTADPAGLAPPATTATGGAGAPGPVAVSADAVAWADPAAPATLRVQADGAATTSVALPGPALRVWGAPGLFAVTARVGGRVALLRVDEGPAPRALRVWSGRRAPRVAIGGGSVAVADGRVVLASRRGALRRVVRARRPVDAVGVDGRRLAWIERGARRGARVGVIRLGRVR